jgi:uncharacterized protein YwqG
MPALPASEQWPQRDGRSLAFIGQIDLGSLPGQLSAQGFPEEGLLLFFYDAIEQPWGFDPAHAGSFAVIHAPEREATAVHPWPDDLPAEAQFPACGLAAEVTLTIPSWQSVLVEELALEDEQEDLYARLEEIACSPDRAACRALVGGHPDQIQADMALKCAMVSAGIYCGGDDGSDEDPRPAFRGVAREWRLLLQVPTVAPAGMRWGDDGCIYYWIRKGDLENRRFDRVWTVLQCL